MTATISSDPKLIDAFRNGRDVYATIASIALGVPYEQCLEFNPVTGEVQPEGKERRSIGKVLNLGELKSYCTLPVTRSYAPSIEALIFNRLLSENFVNCITHRCANDDPVAVGNDSQHSC